MEETNEEELLEYNAEFFVPLARMIIENKQWDEAICLLETSLANDELDLEANYLYAFCLFNKGSNDESYEVCKNLKKLGIEKSDDKELYEGYRELMDEI